MKLWCPPFVTETDEALWTDCTWASGLMLANKASATDLAPRGKYQSTRDEREALRAASGDRTGGSSLYDLNRGYRARYGWVAPINALTWPEFLRRMKRGDGAAIQGLYSELSLHTARWDLKFRAKGDRSAHAVYVQGTDRGQNFRQDAAGNLTHLFWLDPLGRGPEYRGEFVPVAEIRRFMSALGYWGAATMRQGSIA